MTADRVPPRAGRRIADPPSMTALATEAVRAMILNGELRPGDRVVENRLSHELGVSRPPLREALAVLAQEGLVSQAPRRGAVVTPMTLHDIYEIVTLRRTLEEMAVRLALPVRSPEQLLPLTVALETLERNAELGSESTAAQDSYAFHLALISLASHGRLTSAYRAVSLQLLMCMGMNRRARAATETLVQRAARHRGTYELVVAGDVEAVLAELLDNGSLSFLREYGHTIPAGSPEATAWLESVLADV